MSCRNCRTNYPKDLAAIVFGELVKTSQAAAATFGLALILPSLSHIRAHVWNLRPGLGMTTRMRRYYQVTGQTRWEITDI